MGPAADVEFSVLIVTKDRPEFLADTLDAILACRPSPGELIVVDGDAGRSAEPAVEERRGLAADAGTELRYLVSDPGLGVQRNRGLEVATGDVVVFLDDDVAPAPGFFDALARPYADPAVIGATGRVVEPDSGRIGAPASRVRRILFPGGEQGSMTAFGYPRRIVDPDRPGDVEWMQGCFMSARIDQARAVPHDELITARFEGEDEDFSYRLSQRGRLRYEPTAVLDHKQLGFRESSAERQRAFNRDIVLVRTYLFRKNFRRTPLNRVRFAGLIGVLLAHRLLNREWAGARGVAEGAWEAARTREARALLTS